MGRKTNASHDPLPHGALKSGTIRLFAGIAINTVGALVLFSESFRYLNPVL
jgi:hypothetical protein